MKNTQAEVVGQKIWIKSGDETWAYDVVDLANEGRRRKSAGSATPDQIIAPMPGKITKLFVAVGDEVKKGQALLVMEAMKMENNIVATSDGQVKTIHVTVGQSVSQEDPLVELA